MAGRARTCTLTSGDPPRAVMRRSAARKNAQVGRLAARQIHAQVGHRSLRPRTSGRTIRSKLAESVATPGRSRRRTVRGESAGRYRSAAMMTATPTGTLIRKIARQWLPAILAEISAPPRICPTTAPADSAMAYSPIARLRSSPVKFSWMPVSVCGNISAAPAPCRTRARTSRIGLDARPHSSDARVNTPTPRRKIRR